MIYYTNHNTTNTVLDPWLWLGGSMLVMIISRNLKAVSTQKHFYTPSLLFSVTNIFGKNLLLSCLYL